MYIVKAQHIRQSFKTGMIFNYIDKSQLPFSIYRISEENSAPETVNVNSARVYEFKTGYGQNPLQFAIDLQDDHEEVVDLVNSIYNKAITDIANAMGISHTTIHIALKEYSAMNKGSERWPWS